MRVINLQWSGIMINMAEVNRLITICLYQLAKGLSSCIYLNGWPTKLPELEKRRSLKYKADYGFRGRRNAYYA